MRYFEEIHAEERVRNHLPYREGLMNCQWDLVLYEWIIREPNISLLLNTHMHQVTMRADGKGIESIHCIQLGSERTFELSGHVFIDTTGDGVLAYRAGADYRWGREARSEHGEPLAPEMADENIMGSSLFFRAVDTGQPVPFNRPEWAVKFESETEFEGRSHSYLEGGYWWLEIGPPYHPIHDNNQIIHECLRHLLGVWDHIKNGCEMTREQAKNFALEFTAFWPYKRECRRILGDYILTQQHLNDPQLLEDNVAYGVWFIDIHTSGILDRNNPPYPPPYADDNWDLHGTRCYGIPLRALYSRNVPNLMMAGRPISCSYVAFSSTRVLCTGSIVGHAVGVAAALCAKHQTKPREVALRHSKECQQILLREDAYIPGVGNEDSNDLARAAKVAASSTAALEFPGPAPEGEEQELTLPLAQIFPISNRRLNAVDLWFRSTLPHAISLTLGLRPAAHVWDFRGHRDIAQATGVVPALHEGWVTFSLHCRVKPECLYYIHTSRQPGIHWKMAHENDNDLNNRCPVGVSPASFPGHKFWRQIRDGRSLCMRLSPESRPFEAGNINRGTHRPDRWTNLWMSDPAAGLPAWLELSWRRPQRFNRVQIMFDTNMNRRVRKELFRYPECVKDYRVEYEGGSGWQTLFDVRDNYMRRRVHTFETITSCRLRIVVLATNGVPNARIYEVRVYNDLV